MRDRTLLTAVASTLLFLTAAPAWAQSPDTGGGSSAPGADAFDIRYYVTDENSDRGRQMSQQDMNLFVNQARCECGQQIEAQIRLLSTGTTYTPTTIDGYIGSNCATAESSFNPQFKPCAKFSSAQSTTYTSGQSVLFSPIWLIAGIADLVNVNDLASRIPAVATPAGTCTGPTGEGGIWLCGQTDSSAGCQAEEFFVTGTQNMNFLDGTAKGITADFQPPLNLPSEDSLSAAVGDSAVVVNWTLPAGGTDAYGYRVLCEEADTGLPAIEGLVKDPGIASNTYGTIYYTKENLCPDGAFWEAPGSESSTGGDTTGGDTTGGDTTGDTTGDMTTGTTGDMTTGTTGDMTTGTSGDMTTDATTGTTGSDIPVSTACPEDRPATGMCSLKWAYVCSEHIAGATSNVRITGLENDKEYNFLLVAYDQSGNPITVGKIDGIVPVQTNDLWEQCEADGDVCGRSGFCSVDPEGDDLGGFALVLGLGLLAARRRRIRTIA